MPSQFSRWKLPPLIHLGSTFHYILTVKDTEVRLTRLLPRSDTAPLGLDTKGDIRIPYLSDLQFVEA